VTLIGAASGSHSAGSSLPTFTYILILRGDNSQGFTLVVRYDCLCGLRTDLVKVLLVYSTFAQTTFSAGHFRLKSRGTFEPQEKAGVAVSLVLTEGAFVGGVPLPGVAVSLVLTRGAFVGGALLPIVAGALVLTGGAHVGGAPLPGCDDVVLGARVEGTIGWVVVDGEVLAGAIWGVVFTSHPESSSLGTYPFKHFVFSDLQ